MRSRVPWSVAPTASNASSASTPGLTPSNERTERGCQTWGFVKTRPNYPWTKVELRAEPGAVFRVSGATYSDALACLARVRSALHSVNVSWPGKALTLHIHPQCSQEDMMHLDVAVAAGLMAIQGMVAHANSLQTLAFCGMLGLEGDVVNPLPHRIVAESLHRCRCRNLSRSVPSSAWTPRSPTPPLCTPPCT